MSNKFAAKVTHLNGSAAKMLFIIALHDGEFIVPTTRALDDAFGMGRTPCRSAERELIAAGLIRVEQEQIPCSNGRRMERRYILTYPPK